MKTMTCRQMGGPCDTAIHAASAEEMMAEGGKHLKEMSDQGDEGHKMALAMMNKGPDSPENIAWMDKLRADFAALPEDN
jgi:hypothetical protein